VPRDLGLVTVDDDYFATTSVPPLTTVRQPTLELGRTVADVLIDLVEGRPVERVTILPTTVVARGSE
jgi:DNA-binding LacI/PurR family transcriptional regulator